MIRIQLILLALTLKIPGILPVYLLSTFPKIQEKDRKEKDHTLLRSKNTVKRMHQVTVTRALLHLSFLKSPRLFLHTEYFREKLRDHHFFPNWPLLSARSPHYFCISTGALPPACSSLHGKLVVHLTRVWFQCCYKLGNKLSLRISKRED